MAARRRVVWSERATRTLDEAVSFIARESGVAAQQVLQQTLEAATSLETLSERGRVVPELRDPAIRELLVLRYRLLYQVTADTVIVLAFIHGARDFARWRQGPTA